MEEEIWKPIPGYEGLYDASSWGRIRSSPGKITSSKRFAQRKWKTRILKPKHPIKAKRKDLRVSLWKDGQCKDFLVARLIAMAWYGIPPEKYTVNHINGDWLDNRPSNLEWCTYKENENHARNTGLKSDQIPIMLIDNSINFFKFRSMSFASLFLDRNIGYICNRIKRGETIAISSTHVCYKIVKWQGDDGILQ